MMMTIICHRFKILSLILFTSFCSTTVAEEVIIDNTASTSTTIDEVVQGEVLATSTTTTITKQVNKPAYSKEKFSDLNVGDCFDTNQIELYFNMSVVKVDCNLPHSYEIVFEKQLDNLTTIVIPPTTELIQLYIGQKCNDFKSVIEIIEWIDPNYSDTWLMVQPLWDEYSFKSNGLDSVICVAHLENVDKDEILNDTSFSITHDINYYVYNTSWEDEHLFGLVCDPSQPAFFSTFGLYYAEADVTVLEMGFRYVNLKHDIEIVIDLTETINYLGVQNEDIFYYFLKVSSLYTHSFLTGNIIEEEIMDVIFETNEGVEGYFSYTNDKGETFESSCSMSDDSVTS